MKNNFLFLLLIFLVSSCTPENELKLNLDNCQSNCINFRGTITDEDGIPINDVEVEIIHHSLDYSYTNFGSHLGDVRSSDSGSYNINLDLEGTEYIEGKHTIRASKVGYLNYEKEFFAIDSTFIDQFIVTDFNLIKE